LRVIENRLQPENNSHIADEQAGFRARRSTIEQMLNQRIPCEKHREYRKELHFINSSIFTSI
jgi:hypothetical protein